MSTSSGLGAHCAERGCHQLDFLPFTCDKCHRTFCLAHRDPPHHSCTFNVTAQRVMPQCPVCQQHVFVTAEDSVDARVNAHILSGCKDHLMKDVQSVVRAKQAVTLRCDYVDGCNNKNGYATMQCKKCRLQYCLSHRFPEQHKCAALTSSAGSSAASTPDKHSKGKALMEKLKREKAEREAQRGAATSSAPLKKVAPPQRRVQTTTLQQIRAQMASVGSYIAGSVVGTSTEQSSSSSSSTSDAVTATTASLASHSLSAQSAPTATSSAPPPAPSVSMRKQAVGDDRIASADRWYWWLDASHIRRRSAHSSTSSLLAVFVNKNWTVGRAVDSVCELAGVENDNHEGGGRQKICLGCERSVKGGRPLPFDLPLHLLTPAVMDGDTVQLLLKEAARTPSPQPAAAASNGIEVVGMGLT